MRFRRLSAAVAAGALLIGGANFARLYRPAAETAADPVSAAAYYRFGVIPNQIVYDLWNVGYDASEAEVMGGLLRFADAVKDRHFDKVILAYRGAPRFILDGDDFHRIGQEFDVQNPVYTLRTFPEKLTTMDGHPAFGRWTGGMLGVLNAQLEDLNALGRRWYLDDILSH